ncbi:MAG TPA: response regulator [Tepidisphaeraceae bacterium]|jgi:CheY-like chemotaxis protein|nr:response regulator [Tepidisphaeraceae bacterium]
MGHVLVVDDDNLFLQVVCRALHAEGLKAVPAASGEEALAKIKRSRPELILLDLVMPGMDGLAVLRTLRLDQETAGIPVIIFSVTTTEDITQKAMALGANAVLLKTRFSIGELRKIVKGYMGKAEAEAA